MASINFFSQSRPFKLPHPRKTVSWIKSAIQKEKHDLNELNFIFCTDEELYQINVQYLNHQTYTDIITFDNTDQQGSIEGDIYISIDRVRDNATSLNVSFESELRRVIIHGVLHLLGYKDKNAAQKREMRKKEDAYLSLYR